MHQRLRTILLLVPLLAIVGSVLATPLFAATPPPTGTQPTSDLDFTPEIPLPVVFEGPQRADNNLLAHYIRAVYIYFIWVVGVVAVVMVIYGGIRWVAAAGNAGQIREAREIIDGAVIGVLIALSSIVLLNIINPRLTRLNVPSLAYVKPGTPLYSKLNTEGGCYEDLACPENFTQTLGGACGGGGVFTHVNPGEPSCTGASTAKGICCRGTTEETKDTCYGFSSVNLKQDYSGSCHAVADVPPPTVKCADLPCGKVADDRRCQGVGCPADSACYLHDGTGECIPPDAYYTFQRSESNQQCGGAKAYFTSAAACGQGTIVVDDGTGRSASAIGTATCPAGQYCAAVVPVRQDNTCTFITHPACTKI